MKYWILLLLLSVLLSLAYTARANAEKKPARMAEMAALRLCWCPNLKPEFRYECRRVKIVYSCWDHWGCKEPKIYNSLEEAECLAQQQREGSPRKYLGKEKPKS